MRTLKDAKSVSKGLLHPELSYLIQGSIFEIRKQYGPGQKEVIYQRLLVEKLKSKNLSAEKEKRINIKRIIYTNDRKPYLKPSC